MERLTSTNGLQLKLLKVNVNIDYRFFSGRLAARALMSFHVNETWLLLAFDFAFEI